MPSKLLALLNIRAGEEKNVFLMLAHYFFMGGAMLFVQSASLALFFEAWDASAMPYIYLGIALIVSSITALFLKIGERTSLARFLILCVLFVIIGTVALRVGLAFTSSKWLLLALPVWSQTLVNISVMAFWTLAGSLFDVRQGKRIFGLMNAGSWLAYVVMGVFTTPLVAAIGTQNLYIVVAVCLLIAFGFQIMILRANLRTSASPETSGAASHQASFFALFRKRYILYIFILIILWRVAYFILDNIFYDRAAIQYPNTADMAGFIGTFFGAVGLLGFITDTFLTGRIISRFGLRAGLLATPILTILCVGALAVTGVLNPGLLLLLFGFAVAGKFVNEGLGFSIDQSSFAVLYQPIAEKERVRAQTVAEGIIQPLAIGLAGGLLLVFNTILKFGAIQLAFVYLLVGGVWVFIAHRLIQAYPLALTEALHKKRFGEDGIPIADLASIEIIHTALKSPHANEVLYALDLLERSGSDTMTPAIIVQLMKSPHPEVRLSIFRRIERLNIVDALPAIRVHLKSEADPQVREAAACTFTVIGKDTDSSLGLLKLNDSFTQRGALIGLLRAHPLQDVLPAHEQLQELARSESAADRLEAARMIYEISNPDLYETLLPLLEDNEQNVKKAALRAAGQTRHPKIYKTVITALESPSTRSLAFSALVAGGDAALPEIINALQNELLHRRIHLRLVRACANIKSEAALHVLESLIRHPNTNLRSRVFTALEECRFKPQGEAVRRVEEQVSAEIRRAAWLLAGIHDLGDAPKAETLWRALSHDLEETRGRLFHLFGFLYDARAVQRARQAIAHRDSNRTAYAIEVMDSTLSQAHKQVFIPLLEDFPARERLQKMGSRMDELGHTGRVFDILTNPLAQENPWVVATALDIAAGYGIAGNDSVWQGLKQSKESLIVRMADRENKETEMLSTVERVLILKSLSMFADAPDEALVELAGLLQEVDVQAGEVVVQEGETGESLFIIVDGRVEVVDDNRVLNQLGARAVFGELSLLDSSPRSATIRAVEESTLLRLDQAPFYEIMSDYVEVAMGTIHMLTRSLRARTGDVLELSRMLGQ